MCVCAPLCVCACVPPLCVCVQEAGDSSDDGGVEWHWPESHGLTQATAEEIGLAVMSAVAEEGPATQRPLSWVQCADEDSS